MAGGALLTFAGKQFVELFQLWRCAVLALAAREDLPH